MSREALETPWGNLGPMTSGPASVGERYSTCDVKVPTGAGRAVTSFHLDFENDAVPDFLRVVMVSGYSAGGRAEGAARGDSSLRTGGSLLNWRAQAYLDPATGDIAEDRRVSVMLTDAGGSSVRGYEPAERAVREAVANAFAAARDEDPGMVPRVYAALMREATSELDDQVGHAERALREARERRDRAAALAADAEAMAAGAAAPAP